MKRLLMLLLLGGLAHASPLETLIGTLDTVCSASVPAPVLDQLGGTSVQTSLCTLKSLAERADGLVGAAGAGAEAFVRQAFRDGFDLLAAYTSFDTELGSIEAFLSDLDSLLKEGLSLEGALGFVSRTAGAERIRQLLTKSSAPAGSLQHTVEESRRLNPLVLEKELRNVETTSEVQEKAGEVLDVAADAMNQAVAALGRGDEGALMLNVVDPLPLNEGISERALNLGQKAVSTRAAVQVMLEFQSQALLQQTTEMTSLIAQVKEVGLQEAQSTKMLSYVARELYAQRLAEVNAWSQDQQRAVEEAYNEAREAGDAFAGVAALLQANAAAMGQ